MHRRRFLSAHRQASSPRRARRARDAVHPGYGFLSENADFARSGRATPAWSGSARRPQAMRAMGDKSEARRRMAQPRGVPCCRATTARTSRPALLRAEAQRIGFPVMVKAAAGGGGRGMRLVTRSRRARCGAASRPRSEAQSAFGDARVAARARRRAARATSRCRSSPTRTATCDPPRRARLLGAAPPPEDHRGSALARRSTPTCAGAWATSPWRVARAVGYVGAGTVEFLLDADGAFWFIEMNTRLQVEHRGDRGAARHRPGRVAAARRRRRAAAAAAGRALARFEPAATRSRCGCAPRIPAHGFLPQSGRIARWSRAAAACAATTRSPTAPRSARSTTRCSAS